MISKLLLTVAICAASICMVQGITNALGAGTLDADKHVVSIWIGTVYTCTGSLIGEKHVLTAASCFAVGSTGTAFAITLEVSGGSLKPAKGTGTNLAKGVNYFPHPSYDAPTMNNDVGVLLIDTVITGAAEIGLCTRPFVAGEIARISGWGDTDELGSRPSKLLWTNATMIAKDVCNATYSDKTMPRSMICSLGPNKSGMCSGDAGGPLLNKEKELCGVMTYTEGCGTTPTVYTAVNVVKQFIIDSLKKIA